MKLPRAWRFSGPAAMAIVVGAGPATAEWKELGPAPLGASNGNGGRVTALATHPTDNNTFYLGAASGGVWKFTAGRWVPLTDRMPFNVTASSHSSRLASAMS